MKSRRPTFIKAWREYRGLTQDKLGDRIGMSVPNLSKLERGIIPYTQDHLDVLASALRCQPVDLLIRNPTDPDSIWTVWDALPATARVQAIRIIKALKEDAA